MRFSTIMIYIRNLLLKWNSIVCCFQEEEVAGYTHRYMESKNKNFAHCQWKYAIAVPRTPLFCKLVTRSRRDLSFRKHQDRNYKRLQGTPRTQVAEYTIDIRHIQSDNVVQFLNHISLQSSGAIYSL